MKKVLIVYCFIIFCNQLHAQVVDLDIHGKNLNEVIMIIGSQTPISITVDPGIKQSIGPISYRCYRKPFMDVLKEICKEELYIITVNGNSVHIGYKPLPQENVSSRTVNSVGMYDLRGIVVDSGNAPLSGANIFIKGRREKFVSRSDGKFQLTNVSKRDSFTIKYMGFKTRDFSCDTAGYDVINPGNDIARNAGSRERGTEEFNAGMNEAGNADSHTIINAGPVSDTGIAGNENKLVAGNAGRSDDNVLRFTLFPMVQQLDTVTKGYYVTSDRLNPGKVSGIKARDIQGQPVSDPLLAMDGRFAGVIVSPESGFAGSFVGLNVEGVNSIANGNAPLVIVDGVPLAMSTMSQLRNAAGDISSMPLPRPENIESTYILKDADASAIYGSRGANGIMLVKTKRPAAGKTHLSMAVYSGQGDITRRLKLMNTQQYLAMRHEALRNDTLDVGTTDYDLNGKWDTTSYTDWQKVLLGGHSSVLDANGSLSGGNQQTRFSIGGGYRRETAVFSHNFASTTLSADMTVMHVSDNKKMTVDIGLHYVNNDNQLPISDVTPKILLAPNAPSLYTSSGDLNWENNTFDNPHGLFKQRYQADFNHFLGSCRLTYKLLPRFMLSTNLGYNYIQLNERLVIPTSSMSPVNSSNAAAREHHEGLNAIQSWIVEPQANYSLNLGDQHTIDLLAGITLQQSKQHQNLFDGTNFESDALVENISMAVNKSFNTDENVYRYKGVYARVGYNYNDLIILNFTGRNDGSSRFSAARRSEFFGSAAIAWIFSNTPAFNIPHLSLGKVYANTGKTGNDQLSNYQFYDTYSVSTGYGGVPGLERAQLINYLYRWEILIKSSVGFELCFDEKYTISANYYQNHTRNQLIKYELPAITGYKYTTENLPAVVQNRGLELELEIQQIQMKKFRWMHSLNFTVPYNKLVAYPNIASSIYSSIYEVGQPLNVRFVYGFKGINPATGIAEFKDINDDGKVDKLDRTTKVIGPKFFAGWGNRFTYKGFSLEIFFQLVKQTAYYVPNLDLMPGAFGSSVGNQPLSNDRRWKQPGDEASVQRYAASKKYAEDAATQYNQSDASIVNASYIRLKNVSIYWNLPLSWSTRVKIKSASLFLNSQNFATWTHYKGLDPQTQSFHSHYRMPLQRMIAAGIRISL